MNIEDQIDSVRGLVTLIVHERVGNQTWLFEDAEQEALIRIWQRLEEGHPMPIAIHAAKQAVVDICRGGRTTGSKSYGGHVDSHGKSSSIFRTSPDGEEEYVFEPADHSSAEEQDRIMSEDALRPLLQVLTDRQRRMVYLRHWEGLELAEIGKELGVSHQAVSQALNKSHAKMRAALS